MNEKVSTMRYTEQYQEGITKKWAVLITPMKPRLIRRMVATLPIRQQGTAGGRSNPPFDHPYVRSHSVVRSSLGSLDSLRGYLLGSPTVT